MRVRELDHFCANSSPSRRYLTVTSIVAVIASPRTYSRFDTCNSLSHRPKGAPGVIPFTTNAGSKTRSKSRPSYCARTFATVVAVVSSLVMTMYSGSLDIVMLSIRSLRRFQFTTSTITISRSSMCILGARYIPKCGGKSPTVASAWRLACWAEFHANRAEAIAATAATIEITNDNKEISGVSKC